MELLRKKDVVEQVGVAKSTVSDWISEYHMYIPIVQQGNKTYYRTETLDVLRAIKDLRDRDVSKTQIAENLAQKFPINADSISGTIEKVQQGQAEKTDAMIAVMSSVGKALEHLGRQDERIREQDYKLAELERKQKDYDELMEIMKKEAATSREKSEELELKIQSMQGEKTKGFWEKLFKK